MDNYRTDVKYLFPPDTKVIHFTGTPDKYTALLRSKCRSKEEFRQNWLKQYEKLARVAMRVLLTRPKIGKTVVYKAAFRCQHNTYPASHQRVKIPHRKHTGCPASLKVTIKTSPENRRVRSVDTLRKEYPTIISINHDHNHQLLNQRILVDGCQNKNEKIPSNLLEMTVAESLIEDRLTRENFKVELDWYSLKQCWNSFMEKWELSNSIHLYKAFLKATTCLENCKTVNSVIAALNSVGKKVNKTKYKSKILIQPTAVASPKISFNEININKQDLPIRVDTSCAVDELLVIDQGWIL